MVILQGDVDLSMLLALMKEFFLKEKEGKFWCMYAAGVNICEHEH